MITKISRGGRAAGLMHYLVGPGKRNEHESPHLVAGSAGLMSWYSTDELSTADAYRLGQHMEAPNREFGTSVTQPVKAFDEDAGELRATGERRDAHVWHCSLSLAPGHPEVGDETWGAIASDFVEAMDFGESGGKAPCRWVAVHHGKSVNGGDHIHIAVNLVREDGTKASTHYDYKKASRAAADLEAKYGLEVVEGRAVGRSSRAESMRELAAVEAGEAAETPTARIARTVRACSAGSSSEAEFVRQMRREGLWVRPRFAAGGQEQVVGFSVAERPAHGQRAEWRAAGRLGRDLTLPRLREGWVAGDEVAGAERALEAGAEWRAAWRGAPIVRPEAEPVAVSDETWQRCAAQIQAVNKHLTSIPTNDHAAWAQAAHEASGALAAWSLRTEQTPGELAAASDLLSRSATLHRRNAPPQRQRVSMRGTAGALLAVAAAGSGSRTGQALVLRHLIVTVKAFTIAAERTKQTNQLAKWNATVRRDLETVAARMSEGAPAVPAAAPQREQTAPRTPDAAVPNEIRRAQERAGRGRDGRDFGR